LPKLPQVWELGRRSPIRTRKIGKRYLNPPRYGVKESTKKRTLKDYKEAVIEEKPKQMRGSKKGTPVAIPDKREREGKTTSAKQ